MGWLEVTSWLRRIVGIRVSIPLWDDWKMGRVRDEIRLIRFQFHYGMIGREAANMSLDDSTTFQFHYGMIGRVNSFHLISYSSEVSIPLWDDWKKSLDDYNRWSEVVSIPLWDDWKWDGSKVTSFSSPVSIPLWDDWKRQSRPTRRAAKPCFNSTMGWLEACALPDVSNEPFCFNSTMGWLEVNSPKRCCCPLLVSIPLWDDWKQKPKLWWHNM